MSSIFYMLKKSLKTCQGKLIDWLVNINFRFGHRTKLHGSLPTKPTAPYPEYSDTSVCSFQIVSFPWI